MPNLLLLLLESLYLFQLTVLLAFRLWMLNGQLPAFSDQDNPASFSPHILTRCLMVRWSSHYLSVSFHLLVQCTVTVVVFMVRGPLKCYIMLFSGNWTPTCPLVTLITLNLTHSQRFFLENLTPPSALCNT